jgi:3-hydroxyacyl-CoA dehydrogenase
MLNELLKNVCVLGAAGKMGSGISLLLLQEMARLEAELTGAVGGGDYHLLLIDENPSGLDSLKPYLREHLKRYAEKNINVLRKYFVSNMQLVSNEEMIDYFVIQAMDLVHFDTDINKIKNVDLLFEAIVENVDIKSKVLETIAANSYKPTFFFSNTSSIPIHILNEKGHLKNRLAGFHFYNPPAVQKLVELIFPVGMEPALFSLSHELAKRLNKITVLSKDVAGFIGNGYFIREILFACEKVRELSRIVSLKDAIYMINRVTQDFLIRPMGIFQLIDYVGIDVCQHICQTMSQYLPNELFQDALIDQMLADEIRGGQYPDGSQRDGFFQYEGSNRTGIYAPLRHEYVILNEEGTKTLDKQLGPFPEGHASWKVFQRDPHLKEKLKAYFHNLHQLNSSGAEWAREFLHQGSEICRNLVKQGVAQRLEDVETVLKNGFFHLYGPSDFSAHSMAISGGQK